MNKKVKKALNDTRKRMEERVKKAKSEEFGIGEINLDDFKIGKGSPGEEELGELGALKERVETIEYRLEDMLSEMPTKVYDKICEIALEETNRWLKRDLRRKVSLWITWATVTFVLSLAGLNIFLILKSSFL